MGVDLDSIGNRPTFANPHHAILACGICTPDATFGIETNAIEAYGLRQLRPYATVG